MKKNKAKGLLLIVACLVFIASLFSIIVTKTVQATTFTYDLMETSGITMEMGVKNSSSKAGRTGLLLTGSREGARAEFNRDFAGEFDVEFDLYSKNNALKQVAFLFESETGDEFAIHYVLGSSFTGFYAEIDGERAGVTDWITSIDNHNGKYTKADGESVYLVFNPEDMTVYGGSASSKRSLIWDFSELYNDGKTLNCVMSSFVSYKVTIVFEDIDSGEEGGLLLYTLNGTKLDNVVIRNTSAPRLAVDTRWAPIAGESYKVPQPYVSTILNDEIQSTEVYVSVVQGDKVILENCAWTEDLSVAIPKAGETDFTYTLSTKNGIVKKVVTMSAVSRAKVSTSWMYSRELETYYSAQLGLGATIMLPAATYTTNVYSGVEDLTATVSVYHNGEVVDGAGKMLACEEQAYVFDKEGIYSIQFETNDGLTNVTDSYEFYVSEALPTLPDLGIAATYYVNEKLSLPDADMTLGEQSVSTTRRIIYPSGKSLYNTEVTLDEAGNYEIVYSAMIDGVGYQLTEKFVVYAKNTDLFYNVSERGSVTLSAGGSYLNESERGVFISATNGAEIQYANIIDMTNMKQSDTLLDIRIVPDVVGELNFSILKIRLTDIYDENNYIEIKVKDATLSNAGGAAYIQTAANGQKMGGISSGNGINTESAPYSGYNGMTGFRGLVSNQFEYSLGFSMDYAEKKLFCSTDWQLLVNGNPKYLIADYDDPDHFSTLWGGFTENKCYLTLIPEGLVSSANMVVKTVAGMSLAEEVVVDNERPEIVVNYKEGLTKLPVGIVGVEYELPQIGARDLYNAKTTTRVYSVWNGLLNEICTNGGTFTPENSGVYAIVYTATDVYGNEAEKVEYINVVSQEEVEDIDISFNGATEISAFIGVAYELPQYAVSNGIGFNKVKVTAEHENGEVINVEGDTIVFNQSGEWTLTFEAYDYFGDARKQIKTHTINVTRKGEPIWDGNIVLPNIFINEYTYTLPSPVAYDYSVSETNPVALIPEITVKDGNGERVLRDGEYLAKVATHGEEILVTYKWSAENGESLEKTFVVFGGIVYENELLDMSKYFVTNGLTITLEELSSDFVVNGSAYDGKPSAQFAKEVLASEFSFWFTVKKDYNNFDGVTIYVWDSVDATEKIKVSIYKRAEGSGTSSISFNDGDVRTAQGTFWEENLINLGFSYNAITQEISDGSGTVVLVADKTIYGKAFNGFSSGKAYMSFELEGVVGKSAVTVKQINGQYICSVQEDLTKPDVLLLGNLGGSYVVGDEVEIPAVLAVDVLGEILQATVTVVCPDGTSAQAVGGKLLSKASAYESYRMMLTQAGSYTVQYIISDTAGFRQKIEKTLIVPDTEAPVVKVNGTISKTAKVGDTINISKVTATDNVSKDVKVYVIIIKPSSYAYVAEGGSVKLDTAGTWTIRYFVYDDYYNCTIVDCVVEVK